MEKGMIYDDSFLKAEYDTPEEAIAAVKTDNLSNDKPLVIEREYLGRYLEQFRGAMAIIKIEGSDQIEYAVMCRFRSGKVGKGAANKKATYYKIWKRRTK